MAIILTDFDKIWASTSPLTPYSFSDANYEEGWNFIGSTPPARQMWDSIQKFNDEKAKFIVDNYLALSGGTLTGSIVDNTNSADFIVNSVDSFYTEINGGTTYANGAWIRLNGKDNTGNEGHFQLRANDGVNSVSLLGQPNGTLTWNGSNVLTDATVGTIISDSISSSVSLVANTPKTITSVSLGVGTWIVKGKAYFSSNTADRIYGIQVSTTANDHSYSSSGSTAVQTATTGNIAIQTIDFFVLSATTTMYLNGFSNNSATVTAGIIQAIRIV